MKPARFEQPIYVTRPMLPPLNDMVQRLESIWDSGWLTNGGAQHTAFEAALRDILKAQHLSLFNNGTIALTTACRALRLSGEVITTPFTFPATPHVLSWNGLTPVFVDIDPVTMNLDPAKIERAITNATSAILAVHVFGAPCDVEAIQSIADIHGLKVIYDAAHAFGVEIAGRPITDFGDATMLSFHATKLLHTAEGGALVCHDAHLKQRIDLLRNFGIQNEFEVVMPGINGKMSELHAALGLENLKLIDREKSQRARVAGIYFNRLLAQDCVSLPVYQKNVLQSMQYFPIRISSSDNKNIRDRLFEGLRDYNIFARKYFYPLCSDYSCYRMLPSADGRLLPNAKKIVEEILCLPFYGALTDDDVEKICDIIDYNLSKII